MTETVETIENISQNSNTLVQCLICAAWFAGFFIASRVFKHVVGPRLTRAAQKIERPYLSTLLQSFIRPCALFIALIGLYIGVRLLPLISSTPTHGAPRRITPCVSLSSCCWPGDCWGLPNV